MHAVWGVLTNESDRLQLGLNVDLILLSHLHTHTHAPAQTDRQTDRQTADHAATAA